MTAWPERLWISNLSLFNIKEVTSEKKSAEKCVNSIFFNFCDFNFENHTKIEGVMTLTKISSQVWITPECGCVMVILIVKAITPPCQVHAARLEPPHSQAAGHTGGLHELHTLQLWQSNWGMNNIWIKVGARKVIWDGASGLLVLYFLKLNFRY